MKFKKIIPIPHFCSITLPLLIAAILFPLISFGQMKVKLPEHESNEDLLSMIDEIEREGSGTQIGWNGWALEVESEKYKTIEKYQFKPKGNKEALADISKWLDKNKTIEGTDKYSRYLRQERNLIIKNKMNIEKFFNNFSRIGNEMGKFICSEIGIPIKFTRKDGKLVFLVTRVTSEKIFNTIRTTAKSRASKIGSLMVLPSIKDFDSYFRDTEILYYGMIISYGSKDFSREDLVLNLRAEILAFISSKENCKKFVEEKITDDEFADVSAIYLKDRDMRNFRKIKLSFD